MGNMIYAGNTDIDETVASRTHVGAEAPIRDEIASRTESITKALTAAANAAGVPLELLTAYSKVRFSAPALKKLHSIGVRVPINIVFARPHKQYITSDVALMVRGKVAVRLDRAGLAAIVTNQDRTHSIITEKYMGTALVAPKNIVFARNAVVIAGRGGEGIDPIDPTPGKYDPMNYNFGGSAIYIPVPMSWRGSQVPDNLNLQGDITGTMGRYYAEGGSNGYPSSDVIDFIYQLKEKSASGERILDGFGGVEGIAFPPNMVCRMEPFYKCDAAGLGAYFISGNGFWKSESAYPDAFRVRTGGVFNPPPMKDNAANTGR
jgi:hypothetical protein